MFLEHSCSLQRMVTGNLDNRYLQILWSFRLCPFLKYVRIICLSNGYLGLFLWGKSGRGVKLTTPLYLVPRPNMSGAISPLPQYAFMTWCSVKIKSPGTVLRFTALKTQLLILRVAWYRTTSRRGITAQISTLMLKVIVWKQTAKM
jgi:hypothetical protein